MSEQNEPLYARGRYRLSWDRKRDGNLRSPFLQIVWYDVAAGRNRSSSTGTADVSLAERALDRLYLERERGQAVCHACGRPLEHSHGYLIASCLVDYVEARVDSPSIDQIRARITHVTTFLDATGRLETLLCEQVDEALISEFRKWSGQQQVIEGNKVRDRAPGTTEASVRQWAAAINYSHNRRDAQFPAAFRALKPAEVSRTPTYRCDVPGLAAMFRYCIDPIPPEGQEWSDQMRDRMRLHRLNLLRFLQASVATWARPDAVLDISTDPRRDQWISAAGVLQLNPRGRRQTRKYRPAIPVPRAFAKLLDGTSGFFIPVKSVRKAFEAMLNELGLPRERETGVKLIRRSMATIARKRLGEEHWVQGRMMLGHVKFDVSDLYALPDPANIGRALGITEQIISEIETITPGAFTGTTPETRAQQKGKSQ